MTTLIFIAYALACVFYFLSDYIDETLDEDITFLND